MPSRGPAPASGKLAQLAALEEGRSIFGQKGRARIPERRPNEQADSLPADPLDQLPAGSDERPLLALAANRAVLLQAGASGQHAITRS